MKTIGINRHQREEGKVGLFFNTGKYEKIVPGPARDQRWFQPTVNLPLVIVTTESGLYAQVPWKVPDSQFALTVVRTMVSVTLGYCTAVPPLQAVYPRVPEFPPLVSGNE